MFNIVMLRSGSGVNVSAMGLSATCAIVAEMNTAAGDARCATAMVANALASATPGASMYIGWCQG